MRYCDQYYQMRHCKQTRLNAYREYYIIHTVNFTNWISNICRYLKHFVIGMLNPKWYMLSTSCLFRVAECKWNAVQIGRGISCQQTWRTVVGLSPDDSAMWNFLTLLKVINSDIVKAAREKWSFPSSIHGPSVSFVLKLAVAYKLLLYHNRWKMTDVLWKQDLFLHGSCRFN